MTWSTLERDVLEAFDKANLDLINYDLNNLDNNFGYLFLTPPFLVYDVSLGGINNLPSDNMSIFNNLSAEIAIYNIVSANSTKATQISFNILFDIESMTNFYVMRFNYLLTCYYFEKREDLTIELR